MKMTSRSANFCGSRAFASVALAILYAVIAARPSVPSVQAAEPVQIFRFTARVVEVNDPGGNLAAGLPLGQTLSGVFWCPPPLSRSGAVALWESRLGSESGLWLSLGSLAVQHRAAAVRGVLQVVDGGPWGVMHFPIWSYSEVTRTNRSAESRSPRSLSNWRCPTAGWSSKAMERLHGLGSRGYDRFRA